MTLPILAKESLQILSEIHSKKAEFKKFQIHLKSLVVEFINITLGKSFFSASFRKNN